MSANITTLAETRQQALKAVFSIRENGSDRSAMKRALQLWNVAVNTTLFLRAGYRQAPPFIIGGVGSTAKLARGFSVPCPRRKVAPGRWRAGRPSPRTGKVGGAGVW